VASELDMSKVVMREDMTVELIDYMGGDLSVARSARVSTKTAPLEDVSKDAGLINYLMRERHGTPFEHNAFTFYVEAPIFVFREFMRHRVASYNEESGRYRELDPVFYVPNDERKLLQIGKPGMYTFESGTDFQKNQVREAILANSVESYVKYNKMLNLNVAKEVARMVLPVNLYSSMYVTMNARGLMNFLSLRTSKSDALNPSYPQVEIEMVAEQMEALWAEKMPLTYESYRNNGWVSP
jgi:thymidylate synthase (FAD)